MYLDNWMNTIIRVYPNSNIFVMFTLIILFSYLKTILFVKLFYFSAKIIGKRSTYLICKIKITKIKNASCKATLLVE